MRFPWAISRLPYCCSWIRRTLPNAPSSNTTTTTGSRWRIAVASSAAWNMNPPSPVASTTLRPGAAACAPSAVP
jgi:hypothetical protein